MASDTGERVTNSMSGMRAALAPSATLRAVFSEWPRLISQLENPPPTRQPSPAAAKGIQPK